MVNKDKKLSSYEGLFISWFIIGVLNLLIFTMWGIDVLFQDWNNVQSVFIWLIIFLIGILCIWLVETELKDE